LAIAGVWFATIGCSGCCGRGGGRCGAVATCKLPILLAALVIVGNRINKPAFPNAPRRKDIRCRCRARTSKRTVIKHSSLGNLLDLNQRLAGNLAFVHVVDRQPHRTPIVPNDFVDRAIVVDGHQLAFGLTQFIANGTGDAVNVGHHQLTVFAWPLFGFDKIARPRRAPKLTHHFQQVAFGAFVEITNVHVTIPEKNPRVLMSISS